MSAHPKAGMIARPVSFCQLEKHGREQVSQELYLTDPEGEISCVDFLWAPRSGFDVLDILVSTGRKWVIWQRRGTYAHRMLEISRTTKHVEQLHVPHCDQRGSEHVLSNTSKVDSIGRGN